MSHFYTEMKKLLPKVIVGQPQSAMYCVCDFSAAIRGDFDSYEFVLFCAKEGRVAMNDQIFTLLTAPMQGFYANPHDGKTQIRVAFVESEDKMKIVPFLLKELLTRFMKKKSDLSLL